jgi:hypothetical protein
LAIRPNFLRFILFYIVFWSFLCLIHLSFLIFSNSHRPRYASVWLFMHGHGWSGLL